MMSDLISKLRITGNISEGRQSRGGNQTNSARETAKEHLVFEMVIQSVPMCEHGSAAEMTAPFASRRVTTKNAGQLGTPVNILAASWSDL